MTETVEAMVRMVPMPTVCHMCDKLLVHTFVTESESHYYSLYVICDDCIKVFPEIIQQRLHGGMK